MALADYQTLVDDLVRDTGSVFSAAERDQAIGLAVERYSADRPRRLVEDLTGNDSQRLDLPSGWIDDFSELQALEFPIGNVPPTQIAFELYQGPAAVEILVGVSIGAAESARATYTVKHGLTPAADTIPSGSREAVASWAAATLLDQLASAKSGDQAASIAADSVDHGNAGDRYARRAKELRQRYHDLLGLEPKRNVAAGVVVALPSQDSRGQRRIFHPPPGSIP